MKRSRGQYVYDLVNEGAGVTGMLIGVVTRSGPKQYSVCWESGHLRRYPQGYAHKLMNWAGWSGDEQSEVKARIFRMNWAGWSGDEQSEVKARIFRYCGI